jgi:hypothetical protein
MLAEGGVPSRCKYKAEMKNLWAAGIQLRFKLLGDSFAQRKIIPYDEEKDDFPTCFCLSREFLSLIFAQPSHLWSSFSEVMQNSSYRSHLGIANMGKCGLHSRARLDGTPEVPRIRKQHRPLHACMRPTQNSVKPIHVTAYPSGMLSRVFGRLDLEP